MTTDRRPYGKWYGSARWKRRRAEQLAKEPLCRMCGQMHRISVATVADHIKPHNGNEHSFWYGELQSLCKTCHDSLKQQLERTGHIRGCDAKGMPLDPRNHWNR